MIGFNLLIEFRYSTPSCYQDLAFILLTASRTSPRPLELLRSLNALARMQHRLLVSGLSTISTQLLCVVIFLLDQNEVKLSRLTKLRLVLRAKPADSWPLSCEVVSAEAFLGPQKLAA